MRLLLTSFVTLAISGSLPGQTYTIQTVAGGAFLNNVAGTAASVGPVMAIAADTAGNAYFSVATYGLVYRLDADTGILSIAAGTGIVGFSAENGPIGSVPLVGIVGVALDGGGNLFLLDGTNRVREVSNGNITTAAGDGTQGYGGDGGSAIT